MNENRVSALHDFRNNLLRNLCLTLKHNLVTIVGIHFTGILIDTILMIGTENSGGKLTMVSSKLFQVLFRNLYLFSKVEKIKNLLICFKTNSTKEGGNWQLLLTVNVSIHYIVDIRRKLNPATLKRYDTCTVKLSAIGVNAATKEHTWRTVQLRNNNTFSTIDNEGTVISHVRDVSKEDILNYSIKILMIWICTVEFQLGIERHTVGESPFKTLIRSITGRLNVVIKKLQHKIVAGISNGKVFREDLVQTIALSQFGRSVQLQELPVRFQLHIKKIGIRHRILH